MAQSRTEGRFLSQSGHRVGQHADPACQDAQGVQIGDAASYVPQEPSAEPALDFQPPSIAVPPVGLPTVHSGFELDPATLASAEAKAGGAQGRLLGRLFGASFKRREGAEAATQPEASAASGTAQHASAKPDKPPSGPNGMSPRLWPLSRTFSGKATGVASAPAPDSPHPIAEGDSSKVAQPDSAAAPGSGRRWSLWPRADRRRSISFDARDDLLQQPGLKSQPALPSLPSDPLHSPGNTDAVEPKAARHMRSKSNGQVPEVRGALTSSQAADAQEDPRSGVFSFLSCSAPPKVNGDDDPPSPQPRPPADPNAPLLNLGNLCFHAAVMQCLVSTSGLPAVLWQSFASVPEPPRFAQHEPLSEYVAPAGAAKAPPAAAGAAPIAAAEGGPRAHVPAERTPSASSSATTPRASVDGSEGSVVVKEERLSGTSRQSSASSSSVYDALQQEVRREGDGSEDGASHGQREGAMETGEPASEPKAAAEAVAEPRKAAGSSECLPASQHIYVRANGHVEGGGLLASGTQTAAANEGESAQPGQPPQANGQPSTPPATPAGPPAEAQTDARVAEMSQRAAAAGEGKAKPIIARRLSQAMAYVMSQMVEGTAPVNPLPAVYYLAQYSEGSRRLMNGMQQDVHELWITLNEILNDPANAYPEAGGRLSDIFEGTTRTTRTCKKCSDIVTGSPESFTDLMFHLPPLGSVTVESCLNTYCSPSTITVECAKCKAEDEGPQKGLGKKLKKTMFKGKDDSKLCKTMFEALPPALAIQMHRCVSDSKALVKLETAVRVNLNLSLWKHLSDTVKPSKSKADVADKSAGKAASKATRAAVDATEADAAPTEPPAKTGAVAPAVVALREDDCDYRLYACILHKGQCQSRGHYYAICRARSAEATTTDDDWYLYDDHNKPAPLLARGRSEKYLNLTESEKKEVCMLFYERQARVHTPRTARR